MPGSIPPELEGTPSQDGGPHDLPHRRQQNNHDLHSAVDQLCRDVKDIKLGLFGKNPILPNPETIVGRVNILESRADESESRHKTIAKVAWAAAATGIGLVMHKGWLLISGSGH